MYEPSEEAREWFRKIGYVPSGHSSDNYEIAYGMSDGHGYVTLRFWPSDYGYMAIVESGSMDARRSVAVGICQTLEQMQDIHVALMKFDFGNYDYPMKSPVLPLCTPTTVAHG